MGLILACGAVALMGCDSKSSSGGPAGMEDFQTLVTLYSSLAKTGRRPANEAAFKEDIKSGRLAAVAKILNVTEVDPLFVSKRDGKPIVVIYGQPPAGVDPNVVAYEQEGVDGKRLVGFSLGTIEEVDETRFRELVPNPAPAP